MIGLFLRPSLHALHSVLKCLEAFLGLAITLGNLLVLLAQAFLEVEEILLKTSQSPLFAQATLGVHFPGATGNKQHQHHHGHGNTSHELTPVPLSIV